HEVRAMNLYAVAVKSHSCVQFVQLTRDTPFTRFAFFENQVGASAPECLKRVEQKIAELSRRIDHRERWFHERAFVCEFAVLHVELGHSVLAASFRVYSFRWHIAAA